MPKDLLSHIPNWEGLLEPGNLPIEDRKPLLNADGTYSTMRTITIGIGENGETALIPTVLDGVLLSDEDAIQHFKDTKEHFGIFQDQKLADRYDQHMHEDAGLYGPKNVWP